MIAVVTAYNHRDISISLNDRDGEELGPAMNDENAPPLSPCVSITTRAMPKRQENQSGSSRKR